MNIEYLRKQFRIKKANDELDNSTTNIIQQYCKCFMVRNWLKHITDLLVIINMSWDWCLFHRFHAKIKHPDATATICDTLEIWYLDGLNDRIRISNSQSD